MWSRMLGRTATQALTRQRTRTATLALSPRAERYVRDINHRIESSGSPYRPDAFWVRAHGLAIEGDEGSEAQIELALTWPTDVDTDSWIVTRSRIYVAIYDKQNRLLSGNTMALQRCVSAYSRGESVTVAMPGAFLFLEDVGDRDLAAHAAGLLHDLIEQAQLPHSDPALACLTSYDVAHASGLDPIAAGAWATITAYPDRLSIQSAAGECSIPAHEIGSITAEEGVLHISAGFRHLVCAIDLSGSLPADILNRCLATGTPFGRIVSDA